MASYIPQGSSRTVQVLSSSQVVEVERIEAATVPHNVGFWRYVPIAAFNAEGSDPWLEPLAAAIEQRLASGLADDAAMVEDTDAFGLVQDFIDFIVSVPPGPGKVGPFTATVRVPVLLLTADVGLVGGAVSDLFDTALAALHAVAD
jgi:hypothetical protein